MSFGNILVPVDFSDVTEMVVEMAARLAGAFKSRVILLHVSEPEPDFVGFEPGPQSVRTAVAHDFRAEHQKLDALKARLAEQGIDATALHIQGTIDEKILLEAREQHADVIVVGSHGHGALYNLLVGSVASAVLKGAECPVIVIPAPKKQP